MLELRPRVARPAGPLWNSTKTLLQTFAMWGVFLVTLPAVVHALEERLGFAAWRFEGPLGRLVGGTAFGVLACAGLYLGNLIAVRGEGTPLPTDTARKLVIAGPYRYVRNPMAMVSFGQGFGVAAWLGSPLVVLYVICGMLIWNCLARPLEERDLEQRFGEQYRRYCANVRCWRVRLSGYRPDG